MCVSDFRKENNNKESVSNCLAVSLLTTSTLQLFMVFVFLFIQSRVLFTFIIDIPSIGDSFWKVNFKYHSEILLRHKRIFTNHINRS